MFRSRRTAAVLATVAAGSAGIYFASSALMAPRKSPEIAPKYNTIPARAEQFKAIEVAQAPEEEFDVVIIGGGSIGAGSALDATLRGFKVACFEKEDFGAGTSSRSTKLIHGGVRYLEKAFTQLDIGQLNLVFEALHERAVFMKTAPFLTNALPIITPCFQYWEVPYYWAGLKVYDLLAFGSHLYPSYYLSANEAMRQFPMMKGDGLKGAVVYYDGQMNDSRMNVCLAATAALYGAAMLNHTSVTGLLKDESGKVVGVSVRDNLTQKDYNVRAKKVVNACGPYVDKICRIDDPNHKDMIVPAQGSHLILPDFYSPANMGLIIPKTKDGRVLFMLPWMGHTIAGTTDEKVELTDMPYAREIEEQFILESLRDHLRVPVRDADVMATWAGIRPLALDPTKTDTQSLSRDHVIVESKSGLVTVTGGKWTTYRRIAQDTIDHLVKSGSVRAESCVTDGFSLVGSQDWDEAFFTRLTQNYTRTEYNKTGWVGSSKTVTPMNTEIATHLSRSYGTQAIAVAELAQEKWGKRLAPGHPYLEAEVVYGVRHEMAVTAVDILARRTRLAFIDSKTSKEVIPRVVDIMAAELGWSSDRKRQEIRDAEAFMQTMSISAKST